MEKLKKVKDTVYLNKTEFPSFEVELGVIKNNFQKIFIDLENEIQQIKKTCPSAEDFRITLEQYCDDSGDTKGFFIITFAREENDMELLERKNSMLREIEWLKSEAKKFGYVLHEEL